MRLLVAENDPALATFLHDGLEYEHYSVDLAEDSDDAKYCVAQRHYDLAILDLDIERGRGRRSWNASGPNGPSFPSWYSPARSERRNALNFWISALTICC